MRGLVAVVFVTAACASQEQESAPAPAPSKKGGVEIYDSEKRADGFAGPREALFRRVLGEVARRHDMSGAVVDCKTTACRIRVKVPTANGPTSSALQSLPWGDRLTVRFDTSDPASPVIELYPVMDAEMAPIDDHTRLFIRSGIAVPLPPTTP